MPAFPPGSPMRHAQPDKKPLLICFSHLRWNFVFQRPQHLLTRAAQHFDVLFFEEPVYNENARPHLDVATAEQGVKIVTPSLPSGMSDAECVMTQRRLLNMLLDSQNRRPTVAWYYTPMALQFSSHLQPPCIVYDCMDELSNFHGAPSTLRHWEDELFRRADLVFTGGQALYEAKQAKHANIHAFPSSIDRAHFAVARAGRDLPDPKDQRCIPHPRIGFFGVIDERTDAELLMKMAQCRSDYHFVMVGPVVKIDPARLPRMPNIHWLGQKHYADLPAYMAHWDAGFMPFAINDATRFISPTKTPEFLAAGLPVVSTPVYDVVRSWGKPGLVRIADAAESMCMEIDGLLAADRTLWLKRVDRVLASTSWDRTFAAMLQQINQVLPVRPSALPASIGAPSTAGGLHV